MTTNEKIDEVLNAFTGIRPVLSKYPNAIDIKWSKETGYFMGLNLDLLEEPEQEGED